MATCHTKTTASYIRYGYMVHFQWNDSCLRGQLESTDGQSNDMS